MSYIRSIENLVNIQGLEKMNVEENGNHLVANVQLRVEEHICPCCGKQLFITLRKRHCVCKKS